MSSQVSLELRNPLEFPLHGSRLIEASAGTGENVYDSGIVRKAYSTAWKRRHTLYARAVTQGHSRDDVHQRSDCRALRPDSCAFE